MCDMQTSVLCTWSIACMDKVRLDTALHIHTTPHHTNPQPQHATPEQRRGQASTRALVILLQGGHGSQHVAHAAARFIPFRPWGPPPVFPGGS